ncbi:hypothetical protein QBC34DRAFT_484742 [Podospora aff. communis PSN243]|uniref:Proteophosphoglycan ppg4 n=1 Tax=Podospora aff. communis PSN243 TaxID=3040156 RepID=A0AAV9GQ45_9PEZI|nr:hypothetical protein QBC34DRAFT_484742 [Podospora aff. communis PSN243]
MSGTASTDPTERFSLVSSFYGPGNIISWLCTVASVFVTWCLNGEHRYKDSISNDLIFALAVPSVASVHALYLMFLSDAHDHETIQQLFTSPDPKTVQHAAAAEAALNVCETFAAAAVLLAFISMVRGHRKRMFGVVIVGLLSFWIEAVVFVRTRGSAVTTSNLSRPFLFNFVDTMASILAFLGVWLFLFVLAILCFTSRVIDELEERTNDVLANAEREFGLIPVGGSNPQQDLHKMEADDFIRSLTYISIYFFPLALCAAILTGTGTFGETEFMLSSRATAHLPFFLPKSAASITELDQMVTLCVGLTSLIFNLWQAFKSQRRVLKGTTLDSTWRQETCTIRLLLRLNDELDRAQNETERQEILDRRSTFLLRRVSSRLHVQ